MHNFDSVYFFLERDLNLEEPIAGKSSSLGSRLASTPTSTWDSEIGIRLELP